MSSWTVDSIHALVEGLKDRGVKSVKINGEEIAVEFHEPQPTMAPIGFVNPSSIEAIMEQGPSVNPLEDGALYGRKPPRYRRTVEFDDVTGEEND